MKNNGSAHSTSLGQAKIVVILIVLAVVLGVGVYVVGMKKGEKETREEAVPAGWQTYFNSDIGVGFSYPLDFSFSELSEPKKGFSIVHKNSGARFVFAVDPLPTGAEGINMIYHLEVGDSGRVVVASREVIDLGEYYRAPRLDYPNVLNAIASLSDSEAYYFWRMSTDDDVEKYAELFQEILETFVIMSGR